ncbi:MAG: phosphatidylglycerophosphatase A [Rhodospirillaceae bacterium]|nr:phosphatidylglycerophosphatase A [Rhodospirillaceae bacterium]MBT5516171.1 phosphatidylglycerophosphatase A [Rhodospirillaceae bacterium]MBT6087524.1 phosphatidylglycerophosphatase A [Rhodospirillaceae bacterium]MBT6883042.1 phosphatidylglycerophosphatase A [Rhodospirillaceae bacterium]
MTQPNANPSLSDPSILLATWFGAGYLPKAPGTWGSLAALPFAWVIAEWSGGVGLAVAVLIVFGVGLWASVGYLRLGGGEDPGPIVIDEVAGQWLTLVPFAPDPLLYGLGFVFFRIADIIKPWPVSWADGHVKGPMGIMLDDVLAGIYAGAALYAVNVYLLAGGQ